MSGEASQPATSGGSRGKVRLDLAVVERRLAPTRARAQAIVMGGGITVDGAVVTKPSALVTPESAIALVAEPLPYVSRGGLKLRHALDRFEVTVEDAVAIDVGASTGGFTDVLLQAGARRVYAIDVGYGQLAWTLRNDPRVIVMERTNIRTVEELPERATVGAVDVSFISLRQVLPHLSRLLANASDIVALVKPQFEAGRAQVGRKGVVRDPRVWAQVLEAVAGTARELGWSIGGIERSPIRGPAGNVEFLMYLWRGRGGGEVEVAGAIRRVLSESEPEETEG